MTAETSNARGEWVLERLRGVLEHGKMGDKCLIAPDLVTAAIAALSTQQPPAEAQARPAKPAECADGCPDQQVCDHCQWPPGPDAEAPPVAWLWEEKDYSGAWKEKAGLSVPKYEEQDKWVRNVQPLHACPPPSAPVGVSSTEREWLQYAIDHMRDDNEPEDATCADVLEALLNRIESAPVGVEERARAIADEFCPHGNYDHSDVIEAINHALAQQPAADNRICSVCDGGPGNDGPCLCGERRWEQPAAAGEEIMVNAAHDVYTLPLQPSGLLSGPRFVVHVPGPEQPAAVDEAMVERGAKELRDLHREFGDGADLPKKIATEIAEAVLVAALAAQPGGSDNDR